MQPGPNTIPPPERITPPHPRRRTRRVFSAGVFALTLGLLAGCENAPREPLNLSDAKTAALAYVKDGRYERALARVAVKAQAWIITRAARRTPGERLAMVFDIDETVLSNLPHMRTEDFGYHAEAWRTWVARGEAPALTPAREVYGTARAHGVAVLFLTGRVDPGERLGTEANLRSAGLGDYAALVMAPETNAPQPVAVRKAAQRAAWEAEGWTIIATIGDQESDLAGGHAEKSFKLPNPFYRIP